MSALRRALLRLCRLPAFAQIPFLVLLLTFLTVPALAQVSVSPAQIYNAPGTPSCATFTVDNGAWELVHLEVWYPWGGPVWWNNIQLDGNGQFVNCSDGYWTTGQYVVTRVVYWGWYYVGSWAPLYVNPAPIITGNIEGVAQEGQDYYLVGWACAQTYASSIDVHVYVGGTYAGGWGTYAGAATANQPNSDNGQIAAACYSYGNHYRFRILLTPSLRQQFGGLRLFVHGISPFGLQNLLIGNSGTFPVPPLAQQILWKKDHIYTPGGAEVITAKPQ